MRQLKKNEQL